MVKQEDTGEGLIEDRFIVWGLTILTVLSYAIARSQGKGHWKIVGEHLMIAVVVISITHYVGDLIGKMGGGGI